MTFAAIALITIVSCTEADERRIYPCHRLAQAPVIDGKLDDEAWNNIPEATGFYIFNNGREKKYAVEKQTYFKAGWTDDAIYLLVRAEESQPEKLIAKVKGNNLWSDDSIEVFLWPVGASKHTQLVANSFGSRCNGVGTEMVNLKEWEAKAVVGKTEWVLELRIPFDVLAAKTPKEGDEWPANVARNMLNDPSDELNTCWPFLVTGFHDVANFGCFIFKGKDGDNVISEENKINRSYMQYAHEEIKKMADLAGKYRKNLAEVSKCGEQGTEADNLGQIWDQVRKLAAQSEPKYRELMPVSRASVTLRQRSDDCIAREGLKALFGK